MKTTSTLSSLAAIALIATPAFGQEEPQARALLEAAAAAMGGLERLEGLDNFVMTGFGQRYASNGNISADPNSPPKWEAIATAERYFALENRRALTRERSSNMFPFAAPFGMSWDVRDRVQSGSAVLDHPLPAVLAALDRHGTRPDRLCLELTETLALSQLEIVDQVYLPLVRGRAPGRCPARSLVRRQGGLPARLSDGTIAIDNRFSRATGRSPVILPGMTPSTVDAPIVAAAANAGFVAELAGGGQVTEPIFRQRMQELSASLEPGQEVVFNALYLDPYLWDLHLRKRALVQQLRREGAPISGVTISAGVPEIAEAKALLDELVSLGIHLNAFKPGNADQVRKVCAIADACPEHTLFVHVEGGKAGGHHSWEDLEQLLIETYHLLRARQNIVLCVGGGIADEARGVALLTGTWSRAHALPDMPVDAIFLGTITMAAREATASPSVKQALARAAGDGQWVYPGDVRGGVTSGKSQLNADIHYLDNSASRAGRLLDTVAVAPGDNTQATLSTGAHGSTTAPVPVLDGSLPEYAEVLRRIEVDGASVKSFAEEARISSSNAGVRVFRAREALRKKVVASCGACATHGCLNCTCKAPEPG